MKNLDKDFDKKIKGLVNDIHLRLNCYSRLVTCEQAEEDSEEILKAIRKREKELLDEVRIKLRTSILDVNLFAIKPVEKELSNE